MVLGLTRLAKTMSRLREIDRSRWSWGLAGAIVLGTGAGLWVGGSFFVREKLAPLISQELSRSLDRPVELGAVERFSWTGVRFGASSIPATATDPDYVNVRAIEVQFQPWQVIHERRLDIQVGLIQPEAVLHQSPDRRWLRITPHIDAGETPPPIEVQVTQVRLDGGKVTLVPWATRRAQTYEQIQARVQPGAKEIDFQTQAQAPGGGTLRLDGTWDMGANALQAQLTTQNVALVPVSELVGSYTPLPVTLRQGQVTSNLAIQWPVGQSPQITGPVQVQGVVVHSPQWAQVQPEVNARLQLTPQQVQITQGQIRLVGVDVGVTGRVDWQRGYDLTAQVPPVAIEQVTQKLGLKAPVQGQVQSEWVVQGNLTQPYIRGRLATVGALRIEQTQLQQASAEVILGQRGVDIARFQMQLPGAQVNGSGRIDPQQRLAIRFQGQAQPEQLLPSGQTLPVRVGTVAVQGQLGGTLAQPQVQMDFQAPQAQMPLQGQAHWQGERFSLRAEGAQLRAVGEINTRTLAADLSVQVRQYDLRRLPITLPLDLALRGDVDFQGRLRGNLQNPDVTGDVGLIGLRVNHWQFEPQLRGRLAFAPKAGVRLDVRGVQDQVAVTMMPGALPQSVTIRRGQALIQGQGRDGRLAVNFRQIPLALFSSGLLQGELQGAALWDTRQNRATGHLQVDQARWGNLVATKLGGQFQWREQQLILSRGELHQRQSRYAFEGQARFQPQLQWQARIQAVDASIQDLVPALMPGDRPGASELATTPIGQPTLPWGEQFAFFEKWHTQFQTYANGQRKTLGLPDWQELQGRWQGQATLQGNHRGELTADFDLRGRDWAWGEYKAERITLQGRYEGTLNQGKLTLQPLQLVQGDSQLFFKGVLGGQQQTGQLLLTQIPASYITQLVELPGQLTGIISGQATLGGSQANPQAKGTIQIQDGTWDNTPIQVAQTSFSYNQGRLNFGAELLVSDQATGVEPVRATGSVPFPLPFSAVKPASDQIELSVQVKNSGLSLMNSLNPFARWQGGQGEVQVDVAGTWREPRLSGLARFQGATIALAGLADALENITGEIRFLDDRLAANDLQAQLSGGTFTLAGIIPINHPLTPADPAFKQPLTLALSPAQIQQKNLYAGQARALVTITGTAKRPVVGGEIELSQGQLFLPDELFKEMHQDSPAPNGETVKTNGNNGNGENARFQNLKITLGKNLQVVRYPNLNITTEGTLAFNGPFNQPQPSGTLNLQRGEVNLFLTRFRLDRTYSNRVVFDPRYGFDPDLDLRLTTTVTQGANQLEGNLLQQRGNFPNEVPITVAERVQGLEAVRIQASVTGRASRLGEPGGGGLELTSSPNRTQEQIIALLGGFSASSSSESAQLFLTNLAGQTLLNQISRSYETDFGGISWRFFPTVLPALPDGRNLQQSALALGGEVRLDIHRFSASFLQMFTSFGNSVSDPNLSQLTLAYRINNQLRIRAVGSSDRDNRLIIEYNKQF
ncbi:MAG: translocation/assembly module TamB domain-containing protein [Gloeomargarita sp. HHBFW_bins_162]